VNLSLAILADQVATAADKDGPQTRLSIFEGYVGVLVVAFLVTLLATPLMRRLAVANGVIDRPSDPRKVHRVPIAYLGGVAVFLGLLAGIFYSYMAMKFPYLIEFHQAKAEHLREGIFHEPVPLSVVLGIIVIMIVGVLDDVYGISPRVKIGGQLFAAAALAVDNVGVKLASGVLVPVAKSLHIPIQHLADQTETIGFSIPLPVHVLGVDSINVDVVYWAGTAIIALAVLGLCNASNLIDGLDGLLSGTTAISSIGLLILALGLALIDDGPRDAQRIVLCLAVLGACLGFLPHNFNPANIFLGDAGSLLLGFITCVIILTLGDTGKTHLVAAGVIIYALPIIDTTLAIVRRKMEGKSISAADDQHLHHMLKRALGVKGAVFALYGIAGVFAIIGAGISLVRARIIYLLAMVLAAYIGVIAIKIARRRFIEAQAEAYDARKATKLAPAPTPERQHEAEEPAPTTGEKAATSPILVTSGGKGNSSGPAAS
jgi:UDP-GlcNAc:undecaprenyl-phosphate GlcNAc-1-phosphate transferase